MIKIVASWALASKQEAPHPSVLKCSKLQKCLDLIACKLVLTISTSKLDAKDTPDAFKHVPDLFWRPRGRKIRFRDLGPENKVFLTCSKHKNHIFSKQMNDLFWGAFFEHVISPNGALKNSQKWVWLAGRILVSPPPPFCAISDPPNAHKTQNPKLDQN